MSNLRKMFGTSSTLEQSGVVIDYGPNEDLPPGPDGVRPSMQFRVARAGGANLNHKKSVTKQIAPHKRAVQIGALSVELAQKIDREAWLESCLLGWDNVTLDGEKLDFTRENADRLFAELPELYNALREESNNISLFREDELEADVGNSGPSSNTDSSRAK